MKKIKLTKLFIHILIGSVLVGTWGYINYSNYESVNQAVVNQIKVNNNIIDETIQSIIAQQQQLKQAKKAYEEPNKNMLIPPNLKITGKLTPVQPQTEENNAVVKTLQEKIDKLEKEKLYYENEKSKVATEIKGILTLFKIDATNPFINIVFLPMLAYFIKKLMDFGFKRLEEKYHCELD